MFLLNDQLLLLWESPCVICCFSLAAFNMSSLCLTFVNLINMCLGVFCLGFILFGTPWVSWTRMIILPHFREVFKYYLLEYFLMVFLFVVCFWDSYDSNIGAFHIVPVVSEVVHISFNSFYFFPLFHLFLPEMAAHSRILPGKSHGRRSPVGYCPWGRKESDTNERFHDHYSLSIFYLTYPVFCLCYSTVCSLQSVFDLIYCIIHYILTLLGPC